MNKKGFTLIEVLIVISIISLVSATSIILFNKSLEKEKSNELNLLYEKIEIATDVYFSTSSDIPNLTLSAICVLTLKDLQDVNLIDSNLVNPVTNILINPNSCVCAYKDVNNNIVYKFNERITCDT